MVPWWQDDSWWQDGMVKQMGWVVKFEEWDGHVTKSYFGV